MSFYVNQKARSRSVWMGLPFIHTITVIHMYKAKKKETSARASTHPNSEVINNRSRSGVGTGV